MRSQFSEKHYQSVLLLFFFALIWSTQSSSDSFCPKPGSRWRENHGSGRLSHCEGIDNQLLISIFLKELEINYWSQYLWRNSKLNIDLNICEGIDNSSLISIFLNELTINYWSQLYCQHQHLIEVTCGRQLSCFQCWLLDLADRSRKASLMILRSFCQ